MSYADKVFSLSELTEKITDSRPQPRILTPVVVRCLLSLYIGRLGSLNALVQTQKSAFWHRWLHTPVPSADSLGRIASQMDLETLREMIRCVYTDLKRNKALAPTAGGLMALVLDGHESHATYKRHCSGCLQRQIHTKEGVPTQRTQFYHRQVIAMLLTEPFPLILDSEPMVAGEDEVATAIRLLQRVLINYPRAFDVVLGDALYTDPRFYNFVIQHGKDVASVLKANQPGLMADAQGLFAQMQPRLFWQDGREYQTFDLSDFDTWTSVPHPVRVVASRETRTVRRQRNGQQEQITSQWLWVTTLSKARANTKTVVRLGHARWCIENQGFNQTVNHWKADHVCKHNAQAMMAFWLIACLAFNLFHAFYFRNLKPVLRQQMSLSHLARWIASELYHRLPIHSARPP